MSSFFHKPIQKWVYFFGLIIAGESIYMLPYMRKTFQTSMEEVFLISNTEIGLLNSMFGILAIICYFPSGKIADRFSIKKLLLFSLVSTGIGGLAMLIFQSFTGLLIIHAFWGITSILTFWAALIKATRKWGELIEQGKSFGLLDAGRGAVAAIIASIATYSFTLAESNDLSLYNVILVYSLAPIFAAIIIGFSMKNEDDIPRESSKSIDKLSLQNLLKYKKVWAFAGIIFCAYSLYLGSFDLPAYAEKTFDISKSNAAIIGTIRDWLRPIMALLAGILADKFTGVKTIFAAFFILLICYSSIGYLSDNNSVYIFWLQLVGIASAAFALRGIYFALLEELEFPISDTGKVVGFVSFIGFTPDAFIHLVSGAFVDAHEGQEGYVDFFLLLAGVALIGMLITFYLIKHQSDKWKSADT